jgi:hypothetical protein
VQSVPDTIDEISAKRLHVGNPASPLFELARVPQPTEWQRIADQIDAALIVARSDF